MDFSVISRDDRSEHGHDWMESEVPGGIETVKSHMVKGRNWDRTTGTTKDAAPTRTEGTLTNEFRDTLTKFVSFN